VDEALSRTSYMRRRYKRLQHLLHLRERACVRGYLQRMQPAPARVLDIPCGVGRFTPLLRAAAQVELQCCDVDEESLRALREAEPGEGTPLRIRRMNIFEPLPFGDASQDLVFNFRFFHHVDDPDQRGHIVRELSRVARRWLVVSYYETNALHALHKRVLRLRNQRRSLPMIPRGEFRSAFEACGCRIVEDRPMLPLLHAHRVVLMEKRG